MQRILSLAPLAFLALGGCGTPQPFREIDLRQVESGYATITPIYVSFKVAFAHASGPAMGRIFSKEQRVCRQVDSIDRRDSIDPNTNLFQASAALDTLCNDIESAYNTWRSNHGLPYDATIPVAVPGSEFKDGDSDMLKMSQWLRHPAALS